MIVYEGKKAYTIKETANLLNVVYATVSRFTAKGILQPVVISGKKYITEDTIREYSEQKRKMKHE